MVNRVHSLHEIRIGTRRSDLVGNVNATNHEDVLLLLDLARRAGRDRSNRHVTRLQRACEGSGQSAGSGSDDVIECRRVRRERIGRHSVVLGDRPMHSEGHRFRFARQMSEPYRTTLPFDAHF